MIYVYILQSLSDPNRFYDGITENLKSRMKAHNAGESKHTAKFVPWRLVSYHAFADKRKAQEFEYYLKTGSGKAFAKKHF